MLRNPADLDQRMPELICDRREKQIGLARKVNPSNFEVQSIASES